LAERAVAPVPADLVGAIVANLGRVVHAPEETLRRVVLCLVAEGHLIIEDFPGVGKTMLAKALARSLDCSFARLQFTPDLLPSDVTGVNVFDQRTNEFEFKPGPVFANLLLVDEVNRASPKTQAALLECMQESQVTVDGVTHPLDRPFMVIATQNPIEYEGTYPLPEAQLDRFAMRLELGYPPLADEAKMLDEQTHVPPLDSLQPVAGAHDVSRLVARAREVYVEESLSRYVVALLRQRRRQQSKERLASARPWPQHEHDGRAVSLVFTTPNGELVSRQTVTKALINAAEAAGLPTKGLGTHTGRRSVVTALYAEGSETIEEIARYVGHASPATTAATCATSAAGPSRSRNERHACSMPLDETRHGTARTLRSGAEHDGTGREADRCDSLAHAHDG